MTYLDAVSVLCRHYAWSREEAARRLDIELMCFPQEYAMDYIKETIPGEWQDEHHGWLRQRIHEILLDILGNQFMLPTGLIFL